MARVTLLWETTDGDGTIKDGLSFANYTGIYKNDDPSTALPTDFLRRNSVDILITSDTSWALAPDGTKPTKLHGIVSSPGIVEPILFTFNRNTRRVQSKEITLATGNSGGGIWSNGTTMYVSNATTNAMFAYNLSNGNRDTSKEFVMDVSNTTSTGIWSDGTTLYVVDNTLTTIFRYVLSTGARVSPSQSDPDIALVSQINPAGIWSNGTTLWVSNNTPNIIHAYNISSATREAASDIFLSSENSDPKGIWSDGSVIWVADETRNSVFAYSLNDSQRLNEREFPLDSSQTTVRGMWSDRTTMYIASTNRIYAYE